MGGASGSPYQEHSSIAHCWNVHYQYDKDSEERGNQKVNSSSFREAPTHSKISSQEFVQCHPASVAGHDAGEGEGTQVEAQAARQTPDLSQEGGVSESRWEKGL